MSSMAQIPLLLLSARYPYSSKYRPAKRRSDRIDAIWHRLDVAKGRDLDPALAFGRCSLKRGWRCKSVQKGSGKLHVGVQFARSLLHDIDPALVSLQERAYVR